MSSFDEYRIHILSELKDLKEGQARQDEDHLKVRDALSDIKESIAALKNNQRWHIQIVSGVWAIVVLGIDALLRKW